MYSRGTRRGSRYRYTRFVAAATAAGLLCALVPAIAASASVTLSVSPNAGLTDGEAVQISATGLVDPITVATEYIFAECPTTATSVRDARCTARLYLNGSAAVGTFSFVYWLQLYRNPGATNCGVTQCVLALGRGPSFAVLASVPISFSNRNSCTAPRVCNTTQTVPATAQAPGLNVNVTGAPSVGTGHVNLTVSSGTLGCPQVASRVVPVAHFTETGFVPSDRLQVTATLPLSSSTSPEQICFQSTVPFRSQTSPTVPKAGTAFLLNCAQVANTAPCVTSTVQVVSNWIVHFVVPGADPNFTVVAPRGRQLFASKLGSGKVGKAFNATFQTRGGITPVSWKIASGHLPRGCAINAATGVITGTPTVKGDYPVVVEAIDAEQPPKTATLPVPIRIT